MVACLIIVSTPGPELEVSSFKKFTGGGVVVACLIIVFTPGHNLKFSALKSLLVVVACLIIVSTPGPRVVRIRARFWSGW